MNYTWEIEAGLLDYEEDEDETNPSGFWLGNKDTNRVFILPEDMDKVAALINKCIKG